jgi:NTE family protein
MLIRDFEAGRVAGALVRMGNSVRQVQVKTKNFAANRDLSLWQSDADVSKAWRYPTNLTAMSLDTFDLIARHGFECADSILAAYLPSLVSESKLWPFPKDQL